MQVNLNIALWNANGLCKSRPEVEHVAKTNHIDIFLISETHLTIRSYFKINGYDLIPANHPNGNARGGAAILIRSNFKYIELPPVTEDWVQCAQIRLTSPLGDLNIAAAYVPPRHTVGAKEFQQLLDSLGTRFLIGGDFNAKHSWWGSRIKNPKGRALFDCIQSRGFKCHSTDEPTYWPTDPTKQPSIH